jgi:hypothetical protein
VRRARPQLRAALRQAPKVSSFAIYQYRSETTSGGNPQIQIDRARYDVRAGAYEDTASTNGPGATTLSLGNDLYVKVQQAEWVKIVAPRSLYRSAVYVTQPGTSLMPLIARATSVRKVDVNQFVATLNYADYVRALGSTSPLAAQALGSMKGISGRVTSNIVLAQNRLPAR